MAAEIRTDVKEKEGNLSSGENQSALADGLMQIFKPAVEELDEKVESLRYRYKYNRNDYVVIFFKCKGPLLRDHYIECSLSSFLL